MSLKTWWAKRRENRPRMDSEVFAEKNQIIQSQVCEIDGLKAQLIELRSENDRIKKIVSAEPYSNEPEGDVVINLKQIPNIVSIAYEVYVSPLGACSRTVIKYQNPESLRIDRQMFSTTLDEHNELVKVYTGKSRNKVFKTHRTKKEVTNDPS